MRLAEKASLMSGGVEVVLPRPRRQPDHADMTILGPHMFSPDYPAWRRRVESGDYAAVELLALLRDPMIIGVLPESYLPR
jgi:hypothetical protein